MVGGGGGGYAARAKKSHYLEPRHYADLTANAVLFNGPDGDRAVDPNQPVDRL